MCLVRNRNYLFFGCTWVYSSIIRAVHVSHLFSFLLFCFLFNFFFGGGVYFYSSFVLCTILPVSPNCPFMIIPLVLSRIYIVITCIMNAKYNDDLFLVQLFSLPDLTQHNIKFPSSILQQKCIEIKCAMIRKE